MCKWRLIPPVAALFLIMLGGLPAAASVPSVYFQVGDEPLQQFTDWEYSDGAYRLDFNLERAGWVAGGSIIARSAPDISYELSVQNFAGGALPFTMTIVNPIDPVTGMNLGSALLSGSSTDFAGDGVGIVPISASMQSSWLNRGTVDLGLGIGSAYVDGSGAPGHSDALGGSASALFEGPPPGLISDLDLELSFSLSGGGDMVTLNGTTSVAPAAAVPEPASALLLLVGVAGGALFLRRRRHGPENEARR